MPLSTKQMEYLALIDYEKFKNVAGLSSAASARELMRVTKNKLKAEYGALGAGLQAANASPAKATPTKASPKKGATPGSKRGKKAREEVNDDDDEESPTKKQKVKEDDGEGESSE